MYLTVCQDTGLTSRSKSPATNTPLLSPACVEYNMNTSGLTNKDTGDCAATVDKPFVCTSVAVYVGATLALGENRSNVNPTR